MKVITIGNHTDMEVLNIEYKREYISNCCGATMRGAMIDMEVCPECREHCEVILEGDEEECLQ